MVQRCFEDFDGSTYAPVLKKESLRLLCHYAVQNKWTLDGMDISNAFLQSDLQPHHHVVLGEIPGFENDHEPGKFQKPFVGLVAGFTSFTVRKTKCSKQAFKLE